MQKINGSSQFCPIINDYVKLSSNQLSQAAACNGQTYNFTYGNVTLAMGQTEDSSPYARTEMAIIILICSINH